MIIEKLVCIIILILFTFAGAGFSLHCLMEGYVMLAPFILLAGFGIGLGLLFEKVSK